MITRILELEAFKSKVESALQTERLVVVAMLHLIEICDVYIWLHTMLLNVSPGWPSPSRRELLIT
jgi:hypothetical protein